MTEKQIREMVETIARTKNNMHKIFKLEKQNVSIRKGEIIMIILMIVIIFFVYIDFTF